jgi:hypothetical protein
MYLLVLLYTKVYSRVGTIIVIYYRYVVSLPIPSHRLVRPPRPALLFYLGQARLGGLGGLSECFRPGRGAAIYHICALSRY